MVTFPEAYKKILGEIQPTQPSGDSKPIDYGQAVIDTFSDKPVVLYGCGPVGRSVATGLVCWGVPILGVCDTHRTGIFPTTGQSIMTPLELREKYPDACVVICTFNKQYEDEISETLRKLGFGNSQILYYSKIFNDLPPFAIISPEVFYAEHYAGYQFAYEQLADDLSRQVLLDTVRMYLTGRPIPLSNASPPYFEPGLIALSNGEVFVDGGACDGGTALQFAKECVVAGVCDWKVYSFEADPQQQETIKMALAPYQNMEIVMKGLWSHETELTFSIDVNSYGSSFVLKGIYDKEVVVPVTSLDTFFESKPLHDWPTFIKMDIEGAEPEALRGARKILHNKCPKLALCVYHHVSHPYELLRIAHECNPDYRFYLRQYTMGYYETVLYAVQRK